MCYTAWILDVRLSTSVGVVYRCVLTEEDTRHTEGVVPQFVGLYIGRKSVSPHVLHGVPSLRVLDPWRHTGQYVTTTTKASVGPYLRRIWRFARLSIAGGNRVHGICRIAVRELTRLRRGHHLDLGCIRIGFLHLVVDCTHGSTPSWWFQYPRGPVR